MLVRIAAVNLIGRRRKQIETFQSALSEPAERVCARSDCLCLLRFKLRKCNGPELAWHDSIQVLLDVKLVHASNAADTTVGNYLCGVPMRFAGNRNQAGG